MILGRKLQAGPSKEIAMFAHMLSLQAASRFSPGMHRRTYKQLPRTCAVVFVQMATMRLQIRFAFFERKALSKSLEARKIMPGSNVGAACSAAKLCWGVASRLREGVRKWKWPCQDVSELILLLRTDSELQAIVDNVGDVEMETKLEGDSTDVVLQASSSHVSLPAAQQAAMSEERDRLLESATEAVISCPVLFDVVESLPEWERDFGALAMDVSSFLRSLEFESRARKRGAVGCILEVRHSVFVRMPSAEDCSTERLAKALEAVDGRRVTAIVLARLLREGAAAPLSLLKEQISKGYRAFVETQPERFLLTAIAALPRGIASKEVVEIIASGYMRLERPPVALLNLVFGDYEGVPSFSSALKRLGLHFGITEWEDLSRPQSDQAAGSRAAATAAAVAVAAAGGVGEAKARTTATACCLWWSSVSGCQRHAELPCRGAAFHLQRVCGATGSRRGGRRERGPTRLLGVYLWT